MSESRGPGPLAEFFARYPGFMYNSNNSPTTEFGRLRRANMSWDDFEVDTHKEAFRDALVKQFNEYFGTNVNSLDSWTTLFKCMGMEAPPATVQEAKKIAKSKYVNIVDLIDAYSSDTTARQFETERALSAYTRRHKRIFPRRNVHAGSLLKFLLRRITRPPRSS